MERQKRYLSTCSKLSKRLSDLSHALVTAHHQREIICWWKPMFHLCEPLFWAGFDFDCCRHCSLSGWGEFGTRLCTQRCSLRTAGIALGTEQSIWAKVFSLLFASIAPSARSLLQLQTPPCLRHRELQWLLSHITIGWLCPAPDVTELNSNLYSRRAGGIGTPATTCNFCFSCWLEGRNWTINF